MGAMRGKSFPISVIHCGFSEISLFFFKFWEWKQKRKYLMLNFEISNNVKKNKEKTIAPYKKKMHVSLVKYKWACRESGKSIGLCAKTASTLLHVTFFLFTDTLNKILFVLFLSVVRLYRYCNLRIYLFPFELLSNFHFFIIWFRQAFWVFLFRRICFEKM